MRKFKSEQERADWLAVYRAALMGPGPVINEDGLRMALPDIADMALEQAAKRTPRNGASDGAQR